ncbi:SDR family NAD(P)-dependent oxidoreductase [Sphaerisporangium sp. NPDC005289]|uniref:SDR family NAD(P)-dependent oxidoreductase n=1 Tax=Sphaerisporangium sp. NPDC005289 TaxID=3155247 RepID=UPI0033BF0E9C
MRTYVITGGTDGIGKGLGLHWLGRGDRVIAVASGEAKGRAFLADAAGIGAADRATFLRADLSTVAGMRRVVEEVGATVDAVDGLVFGAQHFQSRRVETRDGLEHIFALGYLSRFVIGHGLVDVMERADRPVVMNVAGPGGLPGRIHWDDLQLHRKYGGHRASMQVSRCIDLLGVDFPVRHPRARTRYVLYNPMFVSTGLADPLPQPWRAVMKALAPLFAMPVAKAIVPIARLVDDAPEAPVSAFRRQQRLPLTGEDFDPAAADRLHAVTTDLLARIDAHAR